MQRYAASSLTYTTESGSLRVTADGLSDRLQSQVRERNVETPLVDVSDFLKQGGGSVKCMIGDLGMAMLDDRGESRGVQDSFTRG